MNPENSFMVPQQGQATVEFTIVGLFLLVPLFLAIAALGKFLDVQHTADMAARYAAWERTVWYEQNVSDFDSIHQPNNKSANAINNEIGARLINDRSSAVSAIKSSDRNAAGFINGIDPMWNDPDASRYLMDYAQLATVGGSETPNKDIAGQTIAGIASVQVKGVMSFAPPLPTATLAVGTVSLKDVAKNSAVYQRLWSDGPGWQGLDFAATGAILSNTWSANGSGATKDMVTRMVPTAQSLGAIVTAAQLGITAWDPQVSAIEVGKIEVDVIPSDRLK